MTDGRVGEGRKVEGGVNSARVQLVKLKNDFHYKGTLDSEVAHREQHFKPISLV